LSALGLVLEARVAHDLRAMPPLLEQSAAKQQPET
jgi:hypothetical protein